MKVSSLDLNALKEYLKKEDNTEDVLLTTILEASKSYVKSYTGLDEESIDEKKDITMAVLVLACDMYSNREYVIDKSNVNPIAKSILDMHSINLL